MSFTNALLFAALLVGPCIAQEVVTEEQVIDVLTYLMIIGGADNEAVLISRNEPPGYNWQSQYSVAECKPHPKVYIGTAAWQSRDLMQIVVAHEAAHLIMCARYGHMKADPHDAEWLEVNQLFVTLLSENSNSGRLTSRR